jgi:SAM-dependent methyltransferase
MLLASMDTFATLLERLQREPESSFCYPDAAGPIEAKLPASKRESERRLWEEALLASLGSERPARGIALDAGCGEGEYLADLAERFERVLGVDADARRMHAARERHPGAAVFALDLGAPVLAEPLFEGAFRFAQSLQVLGHVGVARAVELVGRLSRLVSPGGTLLLAVPYTNGFPDEFRISQEGVAESRVVSAEEYDACVAAQEPGSLPVRHFAMPSVSALLRGAGLTQQWCAPYGWLSYELADLMVLARRD